MRCKHHLLVIGQILVAGKDIALELLKVVVPEFGSLAVERTCAVLMVSLDEYGDAMNDGGRSNLLIRLTQKTLQRQQHTCDIQNGTPLVLENIQANPALHVDIWVVYGSLEADLRWDIWVASRELEIEFESEAGVGSVFWADDGSSPVKEVTIVRECTDTGSGRCHKRHELALETARCLLVTRSMDKTNQRVEEIPLDDIAIILGARGTSRCVGRRCDGGCHDCFLDKARECYQVEPKVRYPDDASESVRIGSERARSVLIRMWMWKGQMKRVGSSSQGRALVAWALRCLLFTAATVRLSIRRHHSRFHI